MINLHSDIKKILDELEKKKKIEEENSKIKVSNKKKLILDKFFKCKINFYLANSLHEFTSKLEEEKLNMNYQINVKKNSVFTPKNFTRKDENLTFKKQSPAVINREKFYSEIDNLELNPKEKEFIITDEIKNDKIEKSTNNKINNIFEDNFDCLPNLESLILSTKIGKKEVFSKKNEIDTSIVPIESGKKSPNLSNNNLKIKEIYKHHKNKSSFFNDDDFRVSKQETFKIVDKSVNKNLFNMFSINSNISSNIIELENDKHFNLNNNENSFVKTKEMKSEISQNYTNPDILTSNLTSMISFITNNQNIPQNNTNKDTNNNCNIINNFNKIIVDNTNTFDFDFKDSPLIIKQNPSNQNFLSNEIKLKSNKNQNLLVTNATKYDYQSNHEDISTKKTKSLDMLCISNQINIDIIYNNKKVIEDKTRVNLFIN